MPYPCPEDPTHTSTQADFCTVCGALMSSPPVAPPAAVPGLACPHCGVPRVDASLPFCENCGLDFVSGSLDAPPVVAPAAAPASASAAAPALESASSAALWEAVITLDLTPRERPDDALAPADPGERIYLLDGPRLLIGRGSTTVKPQIVLREDSGVSRSHAELVRMPDQTYSLRDLGSANGTVLNGVLLSDQELKPLRPGDRIFIGFWHLITVRGHNHA